MKPLLHLTVLALFFATNVNAQTTSIVEFQDNFDGAPPLGLAAQPEDFAVSLTDMVLGDQSGVDLVFDDVSITTADGTFTFDVTVTPGTGVGEISAADGEFNASLAEIDDGAMASSLFEGGDMITVTISDVQGEVTFDGFVNFGSDNSQVGEGINVNGIDYIRGTETNGDADPRQGIALPDPGILDQDSVDIVFIGDSVSLRGFALQFTQPSTGGLLGDVNLDMSVDFSDIAPFIALLSMQMFQTEADINEDLVVDFSDIAPFIGLLAGG